MDGVCSPDCGQTWDSRGFGEALDDLGPALTPQRLLDQVATVFRHFPTKDALIEATLVRQFDRLSEQASRLAGEPDPGRAVRELIVTLIQTSSTKLTLISLVGESGQLPPAVQEATSRAQAAIGGILARAQDAGVVAGDVTVEEFFVLVRGVGQAAATMPAAPVTLDRAIEIICRGLAPAW